MAVGADASADPRPEPRWMRPRDQVDLCQLNNLRRRFQAIRPDFSSGTLSALEMDLGQREPEWWVRPVLQPLISPGPRHRTEFPRGIVDNPLIPAMMLCVAN
jgi:hypothetical protein